MSSEKGPKCIYAQEQKLYVTCSSTDEYLSEDKIYSGI